MVVLASNLISASLQTQGVQGIQGTNGLFAGQGIQGIQGTTASLSEIRKTVSLRL